MKRVRATGAVTIDDKPLQTGRITFDPQNGEPPGGFEILDGRYEGLVPVGKNSVRLFATMKTTFKEWKGGDGPGYNDPIEVNLLPSRYSDGSIVREVTEEGPNTFDFRVKSK